MQEFDQCPGCKLGLMLEDQDSNGNGLKCLDCGYTCDIEDSPVDGSNDAPAIKENDRTAYWKRRCEAAENVIKALDAKNEAMYLVAQPAWQLIKEESEPLG